MRGTVGEGRAQLVAIPECIDYAAKDSGPILRFDYHNLASQTEVYPSRGFP